MTELLVPNGSFMNPRAEEDLAPTIRHVAAIIREVYPDMHLAWIRPEERNFDDSQPYALVHSPTGRPQYVARRLHESEVNADLLTWLVMHDASKTDVMGTMHAHNVAQKAIDEKAKKEAIDEKKDRWRTVIESKKHTFRMNGRVYR